MLRQQPEGRAGVLRVDDAHVVAHDLARLVEREALRDPGLRDPIGDEHGERARADDEETPTAHGRMLGNYAVTIPPSTMSTWPVM